MKLPWSITFEVSGERFFPSRLSIPFTRQHDPGGVGKFGRYRGMPVPYGAATYQVPDSVPRLSVFQHLVSVFEAELDRLVEAGATDWHISVARYYWGQCNEEYSLEELGLIARLKCGFIYSAYEVPDEEDRENWAMLKSINPRLRTRPNQSLEPTPKSVMHPAAQAARQPWAWLTIKR